MLDSLRQSVQWKDSRGHSLVWPVQSMIVFFWTVKQRIDRVFQRIRTSWTKAIFQDIHQACNYTKYDRYLQIFQFCQQQLAGRCDLHLLSFGCSTGEEAFTLRAYFPDARITGIDINPSNIRTCHRKNTDPKTQFAMVRDETFEAPAPFDAIFCMAVFQRTENRDEHVKDSSSIYPFMKFDQQVKALDPHLAVGGLLILHICNYRFCDCLVASKYEVVETPFCIPNSVPVFNEDNWKLANESYSDIVFRKIR